MLLLIISIPVIEIYFFIKIGSQIGAFSTILLVFITAFLGIIYARYEGFNTLRSGMSQILKNELPTYEIISGATDFLGILIIFPPTRKLIFKKVSIKKASKNQTQDYINGEYEDLEEKNDDKKI